jgi:acetyltransferase-like isoleucine patch superfamily enzyme
MILFTPILNVVRNFWDRATMKLTLRADGAQVSDKAIIFGWRGMTVSADSKIYANATLACSCMGFTDREGMIPHGVLTLGKRCSVLPGVLLATYGGYIQVGDDVSFNPGVIVYGHGGVRIGNSTRIAAGVVIVAGNHNFQDKNTPIMKQGLTCNGITIGNDVWIGARAVVLDGISLGDGCVVAAGAVVTRSFATNSVIGGVPAKLIRRRGEGDISVSVSSRNRES